MNGAVLGQQINIIVQGCCCFLPKLQVVAKINTQVKVQRQASAQWQQQSVNFLSD